MIWEFGAVRFWDKAMCGLMSTLTYQTLHACRFLSLALIWISEGPYQKIGFR